MKRMIGIFATVLLIAAVLCLAVSAKPGVYHFYCVRNREHKQPALDAQMRFVEKYNGYYVDKNHGDDSADKVVYLTFDAGYENGNVAKILDTLDAAGVKGAFFVLDNLVRRNPELIKRMIREGHTVCNHTATHKDMSKCATIEEFRAETERLEKSFEELTGEKMAKYVRPPEGSFSENMMKFADELGYCTIFWSFAYADWDNDRQMSAEAAKKKILDNIHNGEVMLLHPTSATNAEILGDILQTLRDMGYRFGTLEELTGK